MKAICMHAFGEPDVLRVSDSPDPVMHTPGDIVIAIHAASVNAADGKVRRGEGRTPVSFPHVLGRDFSGVVVEAGPNADLKPGDAVFGVLPNGVEGAYAERIALGAKWVARKPASLSHVQAAAVALAGMTALVSLETLELKAGETILIQGGAGGVGGFAILMAKARGARVLTTARTVNHEYVKALGADEALDYTQQNPGDVWRDCDAVLDTVSNATVAQSFATLRSGGRAAFIGTGTTAPAAPRDDLRSLRPAVNRGRDLLIRVLEELPAEAIAKVQIDTMPMNQAARAHERVDTGHVRGKIVLVTEW